MNIRTLPAGEAARLLGVAPATLRSYVKRGHLTASTIAPGRNGYDLLELLHLRDRLPLPRGRARRTPR